MVMLDTIPASRPKSKEAGNDPLFLYSNRTLHDIICPILVYMLYYHHSGTPKVESDVYTTPKVRLNSSIVEKIWRFFKI